jgi:Vacuolar protein sorting 55
MGKCCPGSDDSQSAAVTRQIMVLGTTTAMSLCFLLASGIRYNSEGGWLAMLNLLFVLLLPFAAVITDTMGGGQAWEGYNEKSATFHGYGICFVGILLVLLHTGAIGGPVLALWLTSTVLTAASAIYYFVARAQAKANTWS